MHPQARVALVGALLAGGLFVAWWATGGDRTPVAGTTAGGGLRPAPRSELDATRQAPLPERVGRAPATTAAPGPLDRERPDDEPRLVLEGAVVVVDPDGVEHPDEDGELVLILWKRSGGKGVVVPIDAGRFVAEVEPAAALGIGSLDLGGRPTMPEGSVESFPMPADRFLALRARWPAPLVLRVVDAADGHELERVEVRGLLGWPAKAFADPLGRGVALATEAVSPVTVEFPGSPVDARAPIETLHVRTPTHAWTRLEVDRGRGGEYRVALPAGGTLEVAFSGAAPEAGAFLRVRPPGQGALPTVQRALRDGRPVTLEGVPAGEHVLSVELGDWFREPLSLGSSPATVVPGERTPVTLDLVRPPAPQTVPLAGEVHLPPVWDKPFLLLVVQLLDTPRGGQERIQRLILNEVDRVEAGREVRRFDAGLVQPGRYQVKVFDPPHPIVVEVGPEGLPDLRLEVPDPAEVALRVIDRATGDDAPLQHLYWHPAFPEGVGGGGQRSASWDAASERWTFVAPVGRIVVNLEDPRWHLEQGAFDAIPGRNQLVLQVRRACGLMLQLTLDGEPLPWQSGWRARAHLADDPERVAQRVPGPVEQAFLGLDPPGSWVVTVWVEGHQAPEPWTVRVGEGEVVDVEVALQSPRR